MKYVLIGLLRAYRAVISPLYGQVCRYHPSCSAYALGAVTGARRCAASGSRRGGWPLPPVGGRRLRPRPTRRPAALPPVIRPTRAEGA